MVAKSRRGIKPASVLTSRAPQRCSTCLCRGGTGVFTRTYTPAQGHSSAHSSMTSPVMEDTLSVMEDTLSPKQNNHSRAITCPCVYACKTRAHFLMYFFTISIVSCIQQGANLGVASRLAGALLSGLGVLLDLLLGGLGRLLCALGCSTQSVLGAFSSALCGALGTFCCALSCLLRAEFQGPPQPGRHCQQCLDL